MLTGGGTKKGQYEAIATARALLADLMKRPNPMKLLVPWGDAPAADEQEDNNGTP